MGREQRRRNSGASALLRLPAIVARRTIVRVSVECRPKAESSTGGATSGVRKRYGWRRVGVLVAVHLAIVAHIVHWKWSGSTLSPVEPSEATDLAEHGKLNAGAVFFLLTIGSTLLLGRWFCGWACHLVALQDGCRWLLQRIGVRPRAIQLGVLGLVPLVACVYMFLGPWLYRLWQGIAVEGEVALFTDSFWATFPGVTMSIVTFGVCGFAAVYFLGSKGFCTYACPYGAIFGIADQFAPQRIRVTDACQGCGKCTIACSSNVRVHQEVRDFGAVVDPGCMKCLDCVSACPTEALYVGFGAPALWTKQRTPVRAAPSTDFARIAFTGVFVAALFVVLLAHQRQFDLVQHGRFAAALAAGSVVLALLFRGRSTRSGGPSLGEEALVAAAYLGALFVLRGYRPLAAVTPWIVERAPWARRLGLDEGLPLLLSLGLAGLVAYGVLLVARLFSRSEVSLQSLTLRSKGRVTRAGGVFVVAMLVVLGVTAHAAVARRAEHTRVERAARTRAQAEEEFQRGLAQMQRDETEAAGRSFRAALASDPGHLQARKRLAGVYFSLGQDSACAQELETALVVAPRDVDLLFLRGLVAVRRGDLPAAEAAWSAVLDVDSGHPAAREALAALCEERGDSPGAAVHRARSR